MFFCNAPISLGNSYLAKADLSIDVPTRMQSFFPSVCLVFQAHELFGINISEPICARTQQWQLLIHSYFLQQLFSARAYPNHHRLTDGGHVTSPTMELCTDTQTSNRLKLSEVQFWIYCLSKKNNFAIRIYRIWRRVTLMICFNTIKVWVWCQSHRCTPTILWSHSKNSKWWRSSIDWSFSAKLLSENQQLGQSKVNVLLGLYHWQIPKKRPTSIIKISI